MHRYSAIVSTLALVVALTGAGAYALGVGPDSVGTRSIKDGAVRNVDVHNGAIHSPKIAPSAVDTRALGDGVVDNSALESSSVGSSNLQSDAVDNSALAPASVGTTNIQEGAVTADALTLPPPVQVQSSQVATGTFDSTFKQLGVLGTYSKQDPTSVLQVVWSGAAKASSFSCVFQIRVDGQPAGPEAGLGFVSFSGASANVASSAQFTGLPTGQHEVEVWAHVVSNGGSDTCTLSPPEAGIGQTVTIQEVVS